MELGHSGQLGRFFDADFSDPKYVRICLARDFSPLRRHDPLAVRQHRTGGVTAIGELKQARSARCGEAQAFDFAA